MLFVMKKRKDEQYIVKKLISLPLFGFRKTFCIIIHCVSALSLPIESINSVIPNVTDTQHSKHSHSYTTVTSVPVKVIIMLQATTQQTFSSCWSVTSNAIVWGLELVCQDHNEVITKQEVASLAVHCMSSDTRHTGQLSVGGLMNTGFHSEYVPN